MARLLKRAVAAALEQHLSEPRDVCVLVTTDERIRDLNRTHRGIDEATDVLSFPSGLPAPDPLGDIAISFPYALRQARARGVELPQEVGFLAIHGALHLVGFDDETSRDRAQMIEEMNRAAVAAGLKPDFAWASILHEAVI
jgi:probable rRNA maturation factor